jgi:TRAP-type C4-dicarboxylate transport system permease small subunit
MIDTFFTRLSRGIELALAAALVFAVCLNFYNVIERYVFSTALGWADEVQVYIMVWTAFLGAVVVTWRNMHLRMDVLLKMFPPGLQRAIQVFEALVMVLLAGFVAWQSSLYAERMRSVGKLTDVAQMPAWIPHSAVGLGFALILVIALVRLVRVLRPGPAPAVEAPKEAPL